MNTIFPVAAEQDAPFTCKHCGLPSWIDPSDQLPPPDYCSETDHGTAQEGVSRANDRG